MGWVWVFKRALWGVSGKMLYVGCIILLESRGKQGMRWGNYEVCGVMSATCFDGVRDAVTLY